MGIYPRMLSIFSLVALFSVGHGKQPTSFDAFCALWNCGWDMAKALVTDPFYKMVICQEGCNPYYYNDTSPMKEHYQNCTTKCALTYDNPTTDGLMECAMRHKCMTFAVINDTACPAPDIDPEASLASLEGEWWQHYGWNALWDCYPCQHIHSNSISNNATFCAQTINPDGSHVQAPCWDYRYSYDLYTETGTKYFGQTWQLPNAQKGKEIDLFYTYMGSTHNETWYIIKVSPEKRYVLLVDCSYMTGWTNVGSIVWVKAGVEKLRDDEMVDIAAVYKQKLGWNFPGDFCVDQTGPSQCPEPGAAVAASGSRRRSRGGDDTPTAQYV